MLGRGPAGPLLRRHFVPPNSVIADRSAFMADLFGPLPESADGPWTICFMLGRALVGPFLRRRFAPPSYLAVHRPRPIFERSAALEYAGRQRTAG